MKTGAVAARARVSGVGGISGGPYVTHGLLLRARELFHTKIFSFRVNGLATIGQPLIRVTPVILPVSGGPRS